MSNRMKLCPSCFAGKDNKGNMCNRCKGTCFVPDEQNDAVREGITNLDDLMNMMGMRKEPK